MMQTIETISVIIIGISLILFAIVLASVGIDKLKIRNLKRSGHHQGIKKAVKLVCKIKKARRMLRKYEDELFHLSSWSPDKQIRALYDSLKDGEDS